ncbi:hypothetical protein P175DRAFT_0149108 [Aspergillus ochraceoroseus IBT 24754]|uniref:Uncharacterized protein n=1 Tax=Aspergillus ochraceoroseus IBT 24754 TaxID=1392256 RepID=A0A2T5M2W9_9EURO|nr:uncharacterized protein P175DRAFT_0149108 [Aspergillus ochraceoroseus IBT 24754]PTU22883.1 hypothetical protein P175DRAFT_0149108 [Aspergillus ochraceoroseus IBT 24754]
MDSASPWQSTSSLCMVLVLWSFLFRGTAWSNLVAIFSCFQSLALKLYVKDNSVMSEYVCWEELVRIWA